MIKTWKMKAMNKVTFLIFTALSMVLLSFGLYVGGVIPFTIGHGLLAFSNFIAFLAGMYLNKK